MNGQLGGHLVWVPGFAGPNSSVDVLINGKTVQVNKALRYSKIIDSNDNGIPNFYDPNPFDATLLLPKAPWCRTIRHRRQNLRSPGRPRRAWLIWCSSARIMLRPSGRRC